MSKQRKRKLFFTALAFMLPFLILYTVFTIWPVIQGFYVSMHKWGLMGKQKYIGFDNYIKFAGDKKFWSALGNTCKFVVITAPMLVIIALILALLANRQTVMKKGLRISNYLPSILFRGILHCEEHLQSVQWTLKRRTPSASYPAGKYGTAVSPGSETGLGDDLCYDRLVDHWFYHDALHIGLTGY